MGANLHTRHRGFENERLHRPRPHYIIIVLPPPGRQSKSSINRTLHRLFYSTSFRYTQNQNPETGILILENQICFEAYEL